MSSHRRKIAFVSTMSNAPWGGSECLWSDAALHLRRTGHAVAANVCGWHKTPKPIDALRQAGVRITERWFDVAHIRPYVARKACELAAKAAMKPLLLRWLARERPDLLCISNGCFDDNRHLISACVGSGIPYVIIAHANGESMWPDDEHVPALAAAYRGAQRSYFVARANRELLETQLGIRLTNAEHVWNPFNVRRGTAGHWPSDAEGWRLACVARLHPKSKGQDILLKVLSEEPWRSRPVSVSFFGTGGSAEGLRRLTRCLGVEDRVQFRGHVNDVDAIWQQHHALILPSRYEGLPISLVEAMLSHRPAIVTKVGGNAEIIDDGVTGFVAAAPTVEHFASAMERAWQSRGAWQSMGKAAARSMEAMLPADPGAAFAARLLELLAPRALSEQRVAAAA